MSFSSGSCFVGRSLNFPRLDVFIFPPGTGAAAEKWRAEAAAKEGTDSTGADAQGIMHGRNGNGCGRNARCATRRKTAAINVSLPSRTQCCYRTIFRGRTTIITNHLPAVTSASLLSALERMLKVANRKPCLHSLNYFRACCLMHNHNGQHEQRQIYQIKC